ncbi:MAG: PsbP-related protein [Candidatus Kapabacteria bacterium]|nr:PsbP-related protein [Candidatus Kapabacteria bacterium]
MKKSYLLMISGMIVLFLSSCGKKADLPQIKDLDIYKDSFANFSISYPKDWTTAKSDGDNFVAYFPKESSSRFKTYSPDGVAGVRITVQAFDMTAERNLDKIISISKILQPADQFYSAPEKTTVTGIPSTKLAYKFTANDGEFNGEKYFISNEPSIVTVVTFECFGGCFEQYKAKFQEILNSVKVAQPAPKEASVAVNIEIPPASANLVKTSGDGFEIPIPDNFDKVKRDKAMIYIGKRRGDCNIIVMVKDATVQNDLKKIVDDNASKFKNPQPTKEIKIDGQNAYMVNYAPNRDVRSRAYYTIKSDKLYFITLNWCVKEEKDYLPIFQKCIENFKIK